MVAIMPLIDCDEAGFIKMGSHLTQSLLEDGAAPSEVAFALTSVAADMGLQIAGGLFDP
jgi:hypothetical protein